MTQQIVDFKVIKPCKRYPTGALKITARPGMKKEIMEIRRENKGTDRQLLDIFEYQLCNGWSTVPERLYGQLPALTNALILSETLIVDDKGEYILDVGIHHANVGYQVEDEVETLLKKGSIIFEGCDYSLPLLNVGDKVKVPNHPFLPGIIWEIAKYDPEGARPYYVETVPFPGWYARRELEPVGEETQP